MKVYISGKIGEEVISDETREKFDAAEKMLQDKGYRVFNPTDKVWVYGLQENHRNAVRTIGKDIVMPFYDYCLLKDLQKLAQCDAIYMLADWRRSPGARTEHAFASAVGKRFFFEDRFQACEYLCKEMWDLVKKGTPPTEYLEKDITMAEIAYGKKHLDRVWRPIKRE